MFNISYCWKQYLCHFNFFDPTIKSNNRKPTVFIYNFLFYYQNSWNKLQNYDFFYTSCMCTIGTYSERVITMPTQVTSVLHLLVVLELNHSQNFRITNSKKLDYYDIIILKYFIFANDVIVIKTARVSGGVWLVRCQMRGSKECAHGALDLAMLSSLLAPTHHIVFPYNMYKSIQCLRPTNLLWYSFKYFLISSYFKIN